MNIDYLKAKFTVDGECSLGFNIPAQENVLGICVVKSFVKEDYKKEKFSKASDEVRQDFSTVEKILALNNPGITAGPGAVWGDIIKYIFML